MPRTVPPRSEIPAEFTWDLESIFPTEADWEQALLEVENDLPTIQKFRGHVGDGPQQLADWLEADDELSKKSGKVFVYANLRYSAETTDQGAKAMADRARSLSSRVTAATSFGDPEILAVPQDTLRQWTDQEPRLQLYRHFFERLEALRPHVRSAEVEEVMGLATDPFSTAASIHRTLTDTDLTFAPAIAADGSSIPLSQGNLNALLADSDRETRRSAWINYADAHLALKNTMANALSAGIKRDVFAARVRRYGSSLEAALTPQNLPVEVFHNLIDVFKDNLPTWHRYWALRRRALGYDELHPWDIKAPLAGNPPEVPYQQAVEWIAEGMSPLGQEYVETLRRGTLRDRWVDIYPNQGKTSGAFSSGTYGTNPFILMSYTDNLYSLSTLAHELGHSLHSYFTRQTQPLVYSRYGMFVAETASNFNQAMVRNYLAGLNQDRDFQITLIEEAMSNFHRYFFIMPTLARFELEMHERAEQGKGLTADDMIGTMADLFGEGYGSEVAFDRDREGITWAEFSHHLYANFYVFQYATGISAANALARGIIKGQAGAADNYLGFLKAGGSMFPLEALRLAGVDMTRREPVEEAFKVLAETVDRLGALVGSPGL